MVAASEELKLEVIAVTPNPGKIRRLFNALKGGLIVPLGTQAVAGAGEGAHEIAKSAVEHPMNINF